MTVKETSISEIMREDFVSLKAEDRLDFADDVMQLGRIRHMPVLENGRLVGMVSQRDLLAASLSRALQFDPKQRRTFMRAIEVKEVMSREVVQVEPDASVAEAARMMIRHKVGCLPVVDSEGKPIGLVTDTDLLVHAYSQ